MDFEFMMLWEAGYLLPPKTSPAPQEIEAVEPAHLIDGKCSRCGRPLKTRGAHFHLKACQ